ncbi:MAG: ABC transporter permease [Alphaproteobacteria bacterium]|nr:ABC transporter permease [Alphaproteobacteria bacterium]MBM4073807.1 ABC transporter permease [Planctomycetota bacterium]
MTSVAPRPTLFSALPQLFASGLSRGFLIRQLAVREVVSRYRGSWLGLVWSLVNPLLMLAVYTFVFGIVFRVRWGQRGDDGPIGFALVLFAGLIVHGFFAECVTRAPGLVVGNANYVKRVVFPLEILPYVALAAALFHAAVSLVVLLAFFVATAGMPPLTIALLPIVWAPFALLILGLCWFLASLGVYLRDIGQVTQPVVTVLLFLSPVFFPLEALPPALRPWLQLNPLTFIIDQTRAVLLWGQMPDWTGLAAYALVGLLVAWLGFYWFERTRRGFADVL